MNHTQHLLDLASTLQIETGANPNAMRTVDRLRHWAALSAGGRDVPLATLCCFYGQALAAFRLPEFEA